MSRQKGSQDAQLDVLQTEGSQLRLQMLSSNICTPLFVALLQEARTQQKYHQHCSNGVEENVSRLVVSTSHPWLDASPDGLVLDRQEDDLQGVVE